MVHPQARVNQILVKTVEPVPLRGLASPAHVLALGVETLVKAKSTTATPILVTWVHVLRLQPDIHVHALVDVVVQLVLRQPVHECPGLILLRVTGAEAELGTLVMGAHFMRITLVMAVSVKWLPLSEVQHWMLN